MSRLAWSILPEPGLLRRRFELIFLLLPLVLVFWRPILVGGIQGSDIELEFRANRTYGFGQLAEGRLPLWNPYQFCGYPFVASMQSAIFYPPNALFLIFPVDRAFAISALLHLVLAGAFAYTTALRLFQSRLGATMAGIVAAYNLGILNRIYAGHVTMYCGYPWLVLGLGTFWLSTRSPRLISPSMLASASALALSVLAGHPAMPFLLSVGFLLLSLSSATLLLSLRSLVTNLAKLLAVGLLGALLAAVQIVPTFMYLMSSARQGGVGYDFATSSSFSPESFALFVAPFLFGDGVHHLYFGRWFLWELMPYVGIVPLGLLFLTATKRCRTRRLGLTLLVGAVLLALGKHAFYYRFLLDWVPGFSLLRGPARQVHLVSVTISFLSAGALAWLGRTASPECRRRALRTTVMLLLVTVLVAVNYLAVAREPNGWDSVPWRRALALSLAQGDRYEEPDILNPLYYDATFQGTKAGLLSSVGFLLGATVLFWRFVEG